jgi:hypothetical protein
MAKGGKRPGAGRKPKVVTDADRAFYGGILDKKREQEIWGKLLNSEDEAIVIKAIIYLTDKRDGKPAQAIEMTGEGSSAVRIILHGGKSDGEQREPRLLSTAALQ